MSTEFIAFACIIELTVRSGVPTVVIYGDDKRHGKEDEVTDDKREGNPCKRRLVNRSSYLVIGTHNNKHDEFLAIEIGLFLRLLPPSVHPCGQQFHLSRSLR